MQKFIQNGSTSTPLTRAALKDEVEMTAFKSGGPGGQHKNKTESAVRLKHLPTGLIVVAADHRSQFQNREAAWERLLEKLARRRQKRKPRVPTQPSRAAKARRLEGKKQHAVKKHGRRGVRMEE